MAALHGPDTRNDIPATYAADVFSFILSQKSSKFQKDLIDSGLAFQAQVGYQTCKYVGPIQIFLVPNPAKVQEAYKKLLENMNMWDSDDYFTDEQLETAKNLLLSARPAIAKALLRMCTPLLIGGHLQVSIITQTISTTSKKLSREDIKKYVEHIH